MRYTLAPSLVRTAMFMALMLAVAGCDQATKSMARRKIQKHERIEFASGHVVLTRVENTGAFLSAGHSLSPALKLVFLVALPLVVLGAAVVFVLTRKGIRGILQVAVACVAGGGIGNLYDRIARGSVTDFMQIDFVLFRTGIFNVADIFITAGMAIILVDSFLRQRARNT